MKKSSHKIPSVTKFIWEADVIFLSSQLVLFDVKITQFVEKLDEKEIIKWKTILWICLKF